jgi:hypothetical protein
MPMTLVWLLLLSLCAMFEALSKSFHTLVAAA